jgi:low affinity Fe/Cu permease
MSKVIGGIFTVVGSLLAIWIAFLWANSSNFLKYNDPARYQTYLETGLALPTLLAVFLLLAGLTLLVFAKEPNLK